MNNPYLAGNFAPVEDEISVDTLPVTGAIPPELNGQLLRIGPNPVAADPAAYHWFLGNGMVHGLRLRDGRAEWYRNRFVRDDELAAHNSWPPVAGPVPATQLGAGTVNTNIISIGGQRLALVEGGSLPVALDGDLETVGRTDFGGGLGGGFSAHPKVDADTGEVHAAVYSPLWNHVQHVVLGEGNRVIRAVDVPVPGAPMVHDCMITANYFVIFDLPVVLDMAAAEAGDALPYHWTPDYGARVGLLPRRGGPGDVSWHEVEPCYVFHPVNGYEDEQGRVVLDVVRHAKMFATDRHGPNEGATTLDRWLIDPAQTRVSEARLDDRGQEFPRINEALIGKPYRYAYTVATGSGFEFCGVLKHDMHSSASDYYDEGDGRMFMEPVFVAAANASSEDEGWLLSFVYDAARDSSDVVILNAADISAGPVATIQLPRRVPFGFHGNWVADGD